MAALNLVIANLTTTIDDDTFAAAVAAIGLQASQDFQPEWGAAANISGTRLALGGGRAAIDAATGAVVYVGESSNDPTTGTAGVFGYHSDNLGQIPYAFVYLDVCTQYNEVWTCTLSHEVLELLADPTAVLSVSGPAPASAGAPGQTVSYGLEVCDPTQSDTYQVDDVTVSNFVTKAYFGMVGGAAATNHLGLPLAPFGVRPHGYVQYEDSGGPHQINGERVDARRLAARAMLAQHRRNARRAAAVRTRL
jgi:hypothetical protein